MTRRHLSLALAATALALTATASPVLANSQLRFSGTHDDTVIHSCGVVEHAISTVDGVAMFDASGAWIRDVVRFSYDVLYTASDGRTISTTTRQTAIFTPTTGTLHGQGLFLRVAGIGVVHLDVGRLVFDPATGATLDASAMVVGLDDPDAAARWDGAVCSVFA